MRVLLIFFMLSCVGVYADFLGSIGTDQTLNKDSSVDFDSVDNDEGNLTIQPSSAGDVILFGTTDVADNVDGKSLTINRKAVEGDIDIKFYVDQYKSVQFETSSDLWVENNASNFVVDTDLFVNSPYGGTDAKVLRINGYITGATSQKYAQHQVNDTDDEYVISRQDSNIVAINIKDFPLVLGASSTQSIIAAGNSISANASTVVVDPNGNYTMTSAPTISDGNTDQIVRIRCANNEANTVTLQDQDTLAGSNLQLGSTTRGLSGKDFIELQFDGTDWIETKYSNN